MSLSAFSWEMAAIPCHPFLPQHMTRQNALTTSPIRFFPSDSSSHLQNSSQLMQHTSPSAPCPPRMMPAPSQTSPLHSSSTSATLKGMVSSTCEDMKSSSRTAIPMTGLKDWIIFDFYLPSTLTMWMHASALNPPFTMEFDLLLPPPASLTPGPWTLKPVLTQTPLPSPSIYSQHPTTLPAHVHSKNVLRPPAS